jgi:hypothetical protein
MGGPPGAGAMGGAAPQRPAGGRADRRWGGEGAVPPTAHHPIPAPPAAGGPLAAHPEVAAIAPVHAPAVAHAPPALDIVVAHDHYSVLLHLPARRRRAGQHAARGGVEEGHEFWGQVDPRDDAAVVAQVALHLLRHDAIDAAAAPWVGGVPREGAERGSGVERWWSAATMMLMGRGRRGCDDFVHLLRRFSLRMRALAGDLQSSASHTRLLTHCSNRSKKAKLPSEYAGRRPPQPCPLTRGTHAARAPPAGPASGS